MLLALLLLASAAQRPESGAYWQQEVAYEITARLDEPRGTLSGHERIRYTNRSPDTLTTFSLHLYLNAFRPGSRWAAADSAEGRRRFNDLHDPDFAFNHVRGVRIMGQSVRPIYPFEPDSTVVRFVLPRPLPPGDSVTVEMDWDARPSTVPRRQGRAGRRFDFAQWYPKVVVYDRFGWEEHPLYPAGEFYGEFASFLVDLDLPDDQVIGATGVPVCGDPGWARASPDTSVAINYRRDYYGARTPPADCTGAAPGRKRMRWYAENVHHFAFSLNPDYRYEYGGQFQGTAVHVLYQPGDEATWGGGIAVERTTAALAWLDWLFGRFAWPQVTNVHRIERGGTEFPMMIMNGSASQGLIVHELGHNYTMGILANNEWREGWLDEGFTSFQSAWFEEDRLHRQGAYERAEAAELARELDGQAEPPSLIAEKYRDFTSYNYAIYQRGALFFHQLRYIVGDGTMRRILQTFYERWKFKHVDEAAFRAVAEEVSGRDLSTFFAQALHTITPYDYGVGRVHATRSGTLWVTRVEVIRHAPGLIPVDVGVMAEDDANVARATGDAPREWVDVVTKSRPRMVWLDPRGRTRDWNMLNNRKRIGFGLGAPETDWYLHPYFSTRVRRDAYTIGLHPSLWYNDAGGVTLGAEARGDYFGRFAQHVVALTRSTGWGAEPGVEKFDFFWRLRNPVWLYAPNVSQTFEGFRAEGRYGGKIEIGWTRREHLDFGPVRSRSVALQWVAVDDFRYLDPGYYDAAGIVELRLAEGVRTRRGPWALGLEGAVGGGLAYHRNGLASSGRADLDPFYFRGTVTASASRELGARWRLATRAFAGYASGAHDAAKQRQIYLQGADPFEQLGNPFLRSRGALLVGDDMHYHAPGGAGVRGLDARVSAAGAVAMNAELERTVLSRPARRLFGRVAVAAFADVAQGVGRSPSVPAADPTRLLGDAGVGIRADHRIGQTAFTTRFDMPLFVSAPALAQDRAPGGDRVGFRWTFSFAPAF